MPESQGHLAFPDLFMIVGYFLLMLGVGVYFYGRMRRMKDFFSGGNTIPWWLSGVSFYMSSFSVAAFVFYPGPLLSTWLGGRHPALGRHSRQPLQRLLFFRPLAARPH